MNDQWMKPNLSENV